MWQMYDNTHKYTLWGNQLFMKLDCCAMYCKSPLAYYLHRLYKLHAGHLISNKRKQTCLQRHDGAIMKLYKFSTSFREILLNIFASP